MERPCSNPYYREQLKLDRPQHLPGHLHRSPFNQEDGERPLPSIHPLSVRLSLSDSPSPPLAARLRRGGSAVLALAISDNVRQPSGWQRNGADACDFAEGLGRW